MGAAIAELPRAKRDLVRFKLDETSARAKGLDSCLYLGDVGDVEAENPTGRERTRDLICHRSRVGQIEHGPVEPGLCDTVPHILDTNGPLGLVAEDNAVAAEPS